ncbi:MAG: SLC13 family permease [Phaeobacter italicus]|jgi:di/tricarboxylate transporter|uniref:Transporter, divalent anion:Na+ symporter (DASS) family n=1 Tax=Phaeobacter italicus TaxID=481446 RepID=A0A0H5CX98_9RHOB|nr:SLC13 family permease [Phaeobacter italicus]MEC8014843.1 SLC13 family permease [Pseudomonadota bacterium]MBY6044605.1 SLC13 family permease [Phaeobacter italicus]MCI5099572.1 SLC13 family permease [Phaeobacter italicus]MEE2818474.1 SLC13 family permease [Pseudomonadota bacterium]CRL09218.1 transporter, divalent anion:Na+ symporter (DASS) family [Phaeobacter italicus]
MTFDQIVLFSLFAAVFALLLWGRYRYDLVAFSALMIAVVVGVVPVDQAFSGFGHPATLVVALVLVVSAGLVRSGAVFLITRTLVDSSRALGAHIALMGGIGAVLSAFMNNVAALALLMPVDIQTARKAGRAPGLSLMPLSFATILGGMATLIGTPPNIIIAAIRQETLGEPFAMFDFAPVGGIAALAGLVFVALIGWRLIPTRENAAGASEAQLAQYIAELTVPEGSSLIDRRLGSLDEEADKADVAILGLIRNGKRLYGRAAGQILRAGDALVLEATPEALDEFRSATSLDFADAARQEKLTAAGEGLELIEVVVPETARIKGRTAQSLGLAWRQNTVLMGLARQGRRLTSHIRQQEIEAGDILLLLCPRDRGADVTEWLGCLPLAERGLSVTANDKTWLAIALFAGAVLAASLGLIYLPIALGLVVVAYVLTKILPLAELYDHIEWPVVVLLGSMIPLGAALDSAGGTALIADSLLALTEGLPAWVILTVLMVVTMTLSDVLNNTATAIVAAPVGIQMANGLGVSPDPFLMAVAVAASAAFLTPIGHKNNTLVLGPGGYHFGDYWRIGLPLEVLIIAVSIPSILLFWPL